VAAVEGFVFCTSTVTSGCRRRICLLYFYSN